IRHRDQSSEINPRWADLRPRRCAVLEKYYANWLELGWYRLEWKTPDRLHARASGTGPGQQSGSALRQKAAGMPAKYVPGPATPPHPTPSPRALLPALVAGHQ